MIKVFTERSEWGTGEGETGNGESENVRMGEWANGRMGRIGEQVTEGKVNGRTRPFPRSPIPHSKFPHFPILRFAHSPLPFAETLDS